VRETNKPSHERRIIMNTKDNSPNSSSHAILDLPLPVPEQGETEVIPDTLRCHEIPPPPPSSLRLHEEVPGDLRSDFHALVLAASQGDRRAVAAVGIAFGPHLIATAQGEIDRDTLLAEEAAAADLVAEILNGMAQGVFAHLPPGREEGLEWLERTVQRAARISERGLFGEVADDDEDEADQERDDGSGDRWRPKI
jgi:hypothetical protein